MEDRYKFVTETAAALRRGEMETVDFDAIAEELEQVGKADSRELRHRIATLLEHMLKLQFVDSPDNKRLWRLSVLNQQREIDWLFDDSPSLRTKLTPELLARCYAPMAEMVSTKYHVRLPDECPWTWEECLTSH